jgi:hypothetical protein
MQRVWEKRKVTSDTVAEGGPLIAHCKSVTGQIFVNNKPDVLFHVFIHFISLHVSNIKCSSSGDRIVLIHHLV